MKKEIEDFIIGKKRIILPPLGVEEYSLVLNKPDVEFADQFDFIIGSKKILYPKKAIES